MKNKIKINRSEFKSLARKLILDPTIQKLETEHFIFIRPSDEVITVKFKNIEGLSGYFSLDELKNQKELTIILRTLETEINKKK